MRVSEGGQLTLKLRFVARDLENVYGLLMKVFLGTIVFGALVYYLEPDAESDYGI